MSSYWDGLQNSKQKTEIPSYAINNSLPEDAYYTDRGVAADCVKTFLSLTDKHNIKLSEYIFIEPSAGEGCFYDVLPANSKKIALDIKPSKIPHIKKADFLTWFPSEKNKYIVIGNPPFGVRGALALAFIKRAFLFADVVAFILPMSFYSNGKGSNMSRVENAKLLYNKPLKPDAFYLADTGEKVSVNTVFQIWKKGKSTAVFDDYDVSEFVDIFTVCSSPERYCGLGKGRNYDCFIASTFYKDNIRTVDTFEGVKYGSGYGIILKKHKGKIKKILKDADWLPYSSNATNSCKHIRMHSIRKLLGENNIGIKK